MTTFETLEGAARLVALEAHDLRDRLDRVPEVVVAGLKLARRGADLVEVRDVRSMGRE